MLGGGLVLSIIQGVGLALALWFAIVLNRLPGDELRPPNHWPALWRWLTRWRR